MTDRGRFLLDCYAAAADVPLPRFKDWAFATLRDLIPHDSAVWGIGRQAADAIHIVHLRGQPPALIAAYERDLTGADFVRAAAAAAPGRTVQLADLVDRTTYEAMPVYAALCRPFGIEQALATFMRDTPTGLDHLIVLWRADAAQPFSPAQRALKQTLTPHLIAAHRIAQRLHLADAATAGSPAGHALADRAGALHSFDTRFVALLRRGWPDWMGPLLPEPLRAALRAGADTLRSGGLMITVASRGELRELCVAADRAARLTDAERRAALLFADGATFRTVAAACGVAPATARNHLQRAYAKLGVSDKAALARALGRHAG